MTKHAWDSDKINGHWSDERNKEAKSRIATMFGLLSAHKITLNSFMEGGVKIHAWTEIQAYYVIQLSHRDEGEGKSYSELVHMGSKPDEFRYSVDKMTSSESVKIVVHKIMISTGASKRVVYNALGLRIGNPFYEDEEDRKAKIERQNKARDRKIKIHNRRVDVMGMDKHNTYNVYYYLHQKAVEDLERRYPGRSYKYIQRLADQEMAREYALRLSRIKREDPKEYKRQSLLQEHTYQLALRDLSHREYNAALLKRIEARIDEMNLDEED